jgi:hypothetical protein
MIFSLIQDFADAFAAMPREHPRQPNPQAARRSHSPRCALHRSTSDDTVSVFMEFLLVV